MDHQAFAQLLGNYGEFVGAIAVVLTLIYLAIQIRQNTEITRMAAMQNVVAGSAESNNNVATNGELAEIISKGFDDPESLNSIEQIRFNAHCVALYHHLDAAFQMREAGKLGDEVWAKFEYEIPLWIHVPVIRRWFESDKQRLSPKFARFIEEKLSANEAPTVIPTFGRSLPPRAE